MYGYSIWKAVRTHDRDPTGRAQRLKIAMMSIKSKIDSRDERYTGIMNVNKNILT